MQHGRNIRVRRFLPVARIKVRHRYFRAVDKKPLPEWYQTVPGVECLVLDLSNEDNCRRACEGAVEVYNLAADMGGMGFIERFRIECLRSILINTHMIEAAWRAGARRTCRRFASISS